MWSGLQIRTIPTLRMIHQLWQVSLSCFIFTSIVAGFGPVCLDCTGIDDPLSCSHVVHCGDHEQCSVTKYVTPDGHTLYDVGCTGSSVCAKLASGKRESPLLSNMTMDDAQSTGNTIICEHCCASDLCNKDPLCGSSTLQRAGGLLCYNCARLSDPANCNEVAMCGDSQLCAYVHTPNSNLNHGQEWEVGCKEKTQCAKFPKGNCNIGCCNTDICNSGCQTKGGAPNNDSQKCVSDPADILFLLDASGSITSSNFQLELQFIVEFAKHYVISPSNVQIGVITFNSRVYEHFAMNDYQDINSLTNAIMSIPYTSGGTRTDIAIEYVIRNGFTSLKGDRTSAPNFLIVISDGHSNVPSSTKQAATHLHSAQINTFAVGVGSVNLQELTYIASSSTNHVLTVRNHLELRLPLRQIRCPSFQNGPASGTACADQHLFNCSPAVCSTPDIAKYCPMTCGKCSAATCADTTLFNCNSGVCGDPTLAAKCPMTCGKCSAASCKDSNLFNCNPVVCSDPTLKSMCPVTCGSCGTGKK